ncbi:hypothetical protein [Micromonospora cremea]|uniref:Uncharacterized protein n=1 Tax=Micromonospora cremea TaxID=709881 RepID=A0A1N5YB20_9ACTN|nr:hypothetical protein [Micromonospora cremea]SIN06776.1 hypothetical protein SAMN04489832_2758 [Micromonospora cremea]
MPPVAKLVSGKAAVIAEAESTCDMPPVSHKAQVWLEKELNGEWGLWAPKGDAKAACEEIPPAGAWVSCSFVSYFCLPGKWRTRAMVTGTGPSGTPYAFSPDEKPQARIVSCPKPKK